MKRREFILAGGSFCMVRNAYAQTRLPVVALLAVGGRSDGRPIPLLETLPAALESAGWIDGRNVRIVFAQGAGKIDDIPSALSELLKASVDVIVTGGAAVAGKALMVTQEIPIVISGSGLDPVAAGWAESHARSGKNVTGITLFNDEIIEKQIEILKEIAPGTKHLGMLSTRGNLSVKTTVERARLAASNLGLKASHAEISLATDVTPAIDTLVSDGADAVFAITDPQMDNLKEAIAVGATALSLPTSSQLGFYVDAGFLFTYAADLAAIHRRSASFVDRILKGERPAEMPIERPTQFVLRVNNKTARTLGIQIPVSVLVRADEVTD